MTKIEELIEELAQKLCNEAVGFVSTEKWEILSEHFREIWRVTAREKLILEYAAKHPDAIAALLTGEGAVVPLKLTEGVWGAKGSYQTVDFIRYKYNWCANIDDRQLDDIRLDKAGRLDEGE